MDRHYITPNELNEILEKHSLICADGDRYCVGLREDVDITDKLSEVVNDINAKVIPARDTPKMEVWATRDYSHREGDLKAVSLRKSVLGEFMYHLLQFNGRVRGTYVMDKNYKGSYIEMLIELPEGAKDAFMEVSGFQLRKPSGLTPA